MQFGLLENGIDSLKVAGDILLKYYQDHKFQKHQIKDAVFSFMHGVEILAKYIIKSENEEMIFENKKEYRLAKEKIKDPNTENVFNINPDLNTISVTKALNLLKNGKWKLNEKLYGDLTIIKSFRNQLMHYTVDLDEDCFYEFVHLLRTTYHETITFFSKNIPEFKDTFDKIVRENGLTEYEKYLEEMEIQALMSAEDARHDANAEMMEQLMENEIQNGK